MEQQQLASWGWGGRGGNSSPVLAAVGLPGPKVWRPSALGRESSWEQGPVVAGSVALTARPRVTAFIFYFFILSGLREASRNTPLRVVVIGGGCQLCAVACCQQCKPSLWLLCRLHSLGLHVSLIAGGRPRISVRGSHGSNAEFCSFHLEAVRPQACFLIIKLLALRSGRPVIYSTFLLQLP